MICIHRVVEANGFGRGCTWYRWRRAHAIGCRGLDLELRAGSSRGETRTSACTWVRTRRRRDIDRRARSVAFQALDMRTNPDRHLHCSQPYRRYLLCYLGSGYCLPYVYIHTNILATINASISLRAGSWPAYSIARRRFRAS